MTYFTNEVIGVIGGCGVAAAIEFLHLIEKKLVTEYGCIDDYQQPEVLLYQATQAPNRIAYATGTSSVSFAPYFIKAAKILKQSGATLGCIPCNTAHCAITEIEHKSGLSFIHLIDETVKHIVRTYPSLDKVGILCSEGTVHSKIYDHSIKTMCPDLEPIYPSQKLQNLVNAGIYAVKAGLIYTDKQKSEQYFVDSMDELITNGANLIILGCTEIPLAIIKTKYKDVALINTLDILADACIQKCQSRKS